MRRAIAVLVSVIVASVGVVVLTSPANAATRAYGFEGGTGWLGTVTAQDGTRSICVNPIGLFPSGTTTFAGLVSSISAQTAASNGGYGGTAYTSGAAIQELNYAESVWVTTKDNVTAAGLDLFAYSLVADYPGPVGSRTNLDYYSQRAGSSAAAVRGAEATIAKQTLANWKKPASASAQKPEIDIDDSTLKGTVIATALPSTATGVLTLTGATRSGSGAKTIDITSGQVVRIDATPTPGEAMRYTVIASVTWTVPGVPWDRLRKYHTDSPRYAQIDMAPAGNRPTTITASQTADDPLPRTFSPVMSTRLNSQSVSVGETLDDIVVASVADGSGPWLRDDSSNPFPVPVLATGTWYAEGKNTALSALPPSDATVIGTQTLTATGPGTYKVTGPVAPHPGRYTVVWSISSADQPGGTVGKLPANYAWTDQFGESDESGTVRASIIATTTVTTAAQGIDIANSDTITPSLGTDTTSWPKSADGELVAVPFYGTEYWLGGDAQPTESSQAPASAVEVATTVLTATSVKPITSAETTPKARTDGYLVWQWSTPQSDYVDAWTEHFAVPDQVVRVTVPTIDSNASQQVALTDTATDAVTIIGPGMGASLALRWAAYIQGANAVPECDNSTLVFDTAPQPVEVREAGTYTVPSAPTFSKVGIYFWVATLTEPDDGTIVAQGACGDPSETTAVVPFSLSTSALAIGPASGTIEDTATLTGPTPSGATLRFRAFRQDGASARCDETDLVHTSTPRMLTGPGIYRSDETQLPAGDYDWIATAYDRNGAVLQSGRCGDPTEMSTVIASLAHTGGSEVSIWLWLGPAGIATGAALLSIAIWRVRRQRIVR